jgi:hypothetical protein
MGKEGEKAIGTFPYIFFTCPTCQHRQVHQLWVKPVYGLRTAISELTITCDECGEDSNIKEVLKNIVAVTPWIAVEKTLDDAEGYFAFLYTNNLETLPEDPPSGWLDRCHCATCERTRLQYKRLKSKERKESLKKILKRTIKNNNDLLKELEKL